MDRVEQLSADLKRRGRKGLLACILLGVGLGGWSATAQIAGAVVAAGRVVVDGNSKKVQHPTGGIVGALNVKLGDRVKANDVLVRLDDTQVRATLGVIQSQMTQALGRRIRLEAERDGADKIIFPADFDKDRESRDVMAGEQKLFQTRQNAAKGQISLNQERIRQLDEETKGLIAQLVSKDNELTIQKSEMNRIDPLHSKQLVPETRMSALKRDIVKMDGERGSVAAQIARAKAQIGQIQVQILQVDIDLKNEAQKDLREVEARLAELSEKRIAAQDQLNRVEIRSPIDGVVHELNVFTVGGVIQAGETIMMVVPMADTLTIEARIAPNERDQVLSGSRTVLRYTAFKQRTTPEFFGSVLHVAADLSRDQATNAQYYLVRIAMNEAEVAKAAALKIVPGMPVDCFIETGNRTALSYFMKPLVDSFHHIFRER